MNAFLYVLASMFVLGAYQAFSYVSLTFSIAAGATDVQGLKIRLFMAIAVMVIFILASIFCLMKANKGQ